MKALIVDDEKHVRDAIRLLVDWEAHGIGTVLEATDGSSAATLIEKEQPELVFTDMMMPGMDGIALLEWLHRSAPRTKTLVISGHDDFEFVRNTVKYGGMDYILKPIDPGQLEDAVARAVASRLQEDRDQEQSRVRSMEMNQLKPVYWDKMFSQLLAEPSYYASVRETLHREFKVTMENQPCRIAILTMETMDAAVRSKFSSALDLLFFSLINICNEYLGKTNRGFAFRHWSSAKEIVLILWKDPLQAKVLLQNINEGIRTTLGSRFEFGLGSVQPAPGGLALSYKEAAAALAKRNLLQRSSWIHEIAAEEEYGRGRPIHFSGHEDEIRIALRSGSEGQIREALGRWFAEVRQLAYISSELLDLWRHEYNGMMTRLEEELLRNEDESPMMSSQPYIVPVDDSGMLSMNNWERDMTAAVLLLSDKARRQNSGERHAIHEIEEYIRGSYNRDIALQDIADKFFLSREYISRRFKQEFGQNLSDYIVQIRMDKAKQLLVNPQLRISQVAEMVGYADEKYFSKVFKKTAGVSPNEYRKGL